MEYISREALLKSLTQECKDCEHDNPYDCEVCDFAIAMLYARHEPKADVQEVKNGCWSPIMMSEVTGWDLSLTGGHDEVCEYQCSVCGKSNILDEFGEVFLPPYCPWCGAKLKDV